MKATSKKIFLLLTFTVFSVMCLFLPWAASEESGDNSGTKSGGEILKWDVDVGSVKVPQTPDAAEKLREETMDQFPEGTGSFFAFVAYLEPWKYIDLQGEYPDGAWSAIFPYYFGAYPPVRVPFRIEGTASVYDNTGHLAVREYTITKPDVKSFGTAWYLLGDTVRVWDDGMEEAEEINVPYLTGEEQTGVRYFMSQVHLGGVVGGERMKALLEHVNAREVSIQRFTRDERFGIYYIPPTTKEWDEWVSECYVWVNLKNWKIERHEIDFLYGHETCLYYNQLWEVTPDTDLFYLEWLPTRILDVLGKELKLEITTEEPPGPDKFVEHDNWIRINGSKKNHADNGEQGTKDGSSK